MSDNSSNSKIKFYGPPQLHPLKSVDSQPPQEPQQSQELPQPEQPIEHQSTDANSGELHIPPFQNPQEQPVIQEPVQPVISTPPAVESIPDFVPQQEVQPQPEPIAEPVIQAVPVQPEPVPPAPPPPMTQPELVPVPTPSEPPVTAVTMNKSKAPSLTAIGMTLSLLFIGGYAIYYVLSSMNVIPNQAKILGATTTQSNSSKPSTATANWKEYKNEKYGFTFKYPPNFEIKPVENEKLSTKLMIFLTRYEPYAQIDISVDTTALANLKNLYVPSFYTEKPIVIDNISTSQFYGYSQEKGLEYHVHVFIPKNNYTYYIGVHDTQPSTIHDDFAKSFKFLK